MTQDCTAPCTLTGRNQIATVNIQLCPAVIIEDLGIFAGILAGQSALGLCAIGNEHIALIIGNTLRAGVDGVTVQADANGLPGLSKHGFVNGDIRCQIIVTGQERQHILLVSIVAPGCPAYGLNASILHAAKAMDMGVFCDSNGHRCQNGITCPGDNRTCTDFITNHLQGILNGYSALSLIGHIALAIGSDHSNQVLTLPYD